MDGYGRWGHDFKSRASTVPPSRLETVPSLIQPKVADHGFESRLYPNRKLGYWCDTEPPAKLPPSNWLLMHRVGFVRDTRIRKLRVKITRAICVTAVATVLILGGALTACGSEGEPKRQDLSIIDPKRCQNISGIQGTLC